MRIDSPKQDEIPQLWKLWKEAFDDDDAFLCSFQTSAFSRERCRCVFIDEKIVSMLFWFDCNFRGKKLAYLYAVATKKSFQNQGLCRALLKDTHEYLKQLGYRGILLVPGEESLIHFYRKLGYNIATYIGKISCNPSEESLEIRRITTAEYEGKRRIFLPENGVLQEKENTAFLKTMADFYIGKDFLLVGRKKGEEFFGLELLGNISRASAIVGAFGCKSGHFRIPSNDTPFSMFFPLERSADVPKYFGLAFD